MYTLDDSVRKGRFCPPLWVFKITSELSVLQSEHNCTQSLSLWNSSITSSNYSNSYHWPTLTSVTAWSGGKVWDRKTNPMSSLLQPLPFFPAVHFSATFIFLTILFFSSFFWPVFRFVVLPFCFQAQSLSTWCPPLVTTLNCWQRSKQGRAWSPHLTVKATPPSFPAVDPQATT